MSFLPTKLRALLGAVALSLAFAALVGLADPATALELDPSVDDDVLALILSDMGVEPLAAVGCSIRLNNSGAGSTCSCTASGPGAACDCNGKTGGRKVCRCSDATGTIYCYYTKWNSTAKCRCDGNMPPWARFGAGPGWHSDQDIAPDVLKR